MPKQIELFFGVRVSGGQLFLSVESGTSPELGFWTEKFLALAMQRSAIPEVAELLS